MEDLLPFRFILFGLACAGLVYLQFFLAHRQWRRLKGAEAADIDLEYVKIEDCLPKSFRAKAKDWLQLPGATEAGAVERVILKGRERVRVTGPLSMASGQGSTDILVVQGDFSCGPDCRIVREVWAQGNATIGAGTQMQAVAADGALVLEDGVSVARWADSEDDLRVGARCRIGARVTARKTIGLGVDARVLSAYAPQVHTGGWDGSMNGAGRLVAAGLLELGPPEGPPLSEETLREAGIEPAKLIRLSPQCWSYAGDFRPRIPIRLAAGLVVKGRCDLPGGSVLLGDIKAHGSLFAGDSSVCDGNLVSGADICLGKGCQFAGVIHAGGSVLLSSGTRGLLKKDMVAVYAAEYLCVETNVAVNGKLASGGRVVVVAPAQAERWRLERYARKADR